MIFCTLAGYIFGFILFLFSVTLYVLFAVSVFRVIKKIFLNNRKEKSNDTSLHH